jgi:transposase
MSRRAAVKHYQVGEATAIRWVKLAACQATRQTPGDMKN